MMKHNADRHSIAAWLMLAAFGVAILLSTVLGTRAYSRLSERGETVSRARNCAQYIATRARQAESPDALTVESFGGTDAIVLRSDFDGDIYLTRVYVYDGWLTELFSAEDDDSLTPEDGERILPLSAMRLDFDGGLLTALLTEGEQTTTVRLSVRGEGTP